MFVLSSALTSCAQIKSNIFAAQTLDSIQLSNYKYFTCHEKILCFTMHSHLVSMVFLNVLNLCMLKPTSKRQYEGEKKYSKSLSHLASKYQIVLVSCSMFGKSLTWRTIFARTYTGGKNCIIWTEADHPLVHQILLLVLFLAVNLQKWWSTIVKNDMSRCKFFLLEQNYWNIESECSCLIQNYNVSC